MTQSSRGLRPPTLLLALIGLIPSNEVLAKDGDRIGPEALIRTAKAEIARQIPVPKGGTLSITLAPPDPRLVLSPCGEPLRATLPYVPRQGGVISIAVSCTRPEPWSLYLSGRATLRAPVSAAARDLPRGTRLAKDDLILRTVDLSTLPAGYALKNDELINRRLRQPLRKGTPISPRATEAPLWIETGEPIVLQAGQGALAVRVDGIALANGTEDALVSVRNRASRAVLRGRVIAPGVVQLGP